MPQRLDEVSFEFPGDEFGFLCLCFLHGHLLLFSLICPRAVPSKRFLPLGEASSSITRSVYSPPFYVSFTAQHRAKYRDDKGSVRGAVHMVREDER